MDANEKITGRKKLGFFMFATLLIIVGMVALSHTSLAQEAGTKAPLVDVDASFTYQGEIEDGGGLVDGSCDFRFGLWDAAAAGSQLGSTQFVGGVVVDNGRFTTTLNDSNQFGANAFNGAARWLQIDVRCPAGSGNYTPLSPRQELTAAPVAQTLRPGAIINGNVLGNGGDEAMLKLESDNVGLRVESDGTAVYVDDSLRGMFVNQASVDGVHIGTVGSPSSTNAPLDPGNGFVVEGAAGDGLYVGRADDDGVSIISAGEDGIVIGPTGDNGVSIFDAGGDGVHVYEAGNPSYSQSIFAYGHGFVVEGAEGSGLIIGRADESGVIVTEAGFHGVAVNEAGASGVFVDQADVYGVFANTTAASGEWGFYTNDKSHSSNYTFTSLSVIVQVGASEVLTSGDLVSVISMAAPVPGSSVRIPVVRLASSTFLNVIGVVEQRLELVPTENAPTTEEDEINTTGETQYAWRHATGAAGAGDYVSLTVYGIADVKIDAQTSAQLQAGQRLTADDNGKARVLKDVMVDGVLLSEGAPTIGYVLEAPEVGATAVPIFVTLR